MVFYQRIYPQSINIGIEGDFAPWVGALIADVKQPIILVTELGQEEESVTRLSRVGFDNLVGHLQVDLKLGKKQAKKPMCRITDAFADAVKIGESRVIDVRKESEYAAEHVDESQQTFGSTMD
jgi:hypothetical protein